MKTRVMPSASATRQACWPAAPPKQHSVYSVTSWPRCTEICLIALAMLPTAMSTKPSATCSGVRRLPVASRISLRQRGELRPYRPGIERLVAMRPEHGGKECRLHLAQHHVAVGDGERPVLAVAGGAGIGAGGIRPDAVARAVEMQDRAAARGDGVDAHHRRAHAHAGDLGLEGALESLNCAPAKCDTSVDVPPMSKPMILPKPASMRRAHRADDAAGRARRGSSPCPGSGARRSGRRSIA